MLVMLMMMTEIILVICVVNVMVLLVYSNSDLTAEVMIGMVVMTMAVLL